MRKEWLYGMMALLEGLLLMSVFAWWGLDIPVLWAQGPVRYVATTGDDTGNDCSNSNTPCRTVQHAIDQADDYDEIKVASGLYTDVNNYGGLSQVAYITRPLTLRGGYTTTDWTVSYPETQTTTLDAMRQGRVIYITGTFPAALEGLWLTGGGGTSTPVQDGAGVYGYGVALSFSDNRVFSNTSEGGSGVFLQDSDGSDLTSNMFYSNTADLMGGGLLLFDSNAVSLGYNEFQDNYAPSGGGAVLLASEATLSGNSFLSNRSSAGGGIYLQSSTVAMDINTYMDNAASNTGGGVASINSQLNATGDLFLANRADNFGAGLFLSGGTVYMTGTTLMNNSSQFFGGGIALQGIFEGLVSDGIFANNTSVYGGGGAILHSASNVTLNRNLFSDNAATDASSGGGGVLLYQSTDIEMNRNTFDANTSRDGGGLAIANYSGANVYNTLLMDNGAQTGGALYVSEGSTGRFLQTTMVHNTGARGIYLDGPDATLTMSNTILVSHTTALSVTEGSTAILENTLWHGNTQDWDGAGTIVTGTHNYWTDPQFADPGGYDYSLGPNSPAIDTGVNTGLSEDLDGNPRPSGGGYDLGAYEFQFSPDLAVAKWVTPDPVQAGESLRYTIHVTNTGDVGLSAFITDTLPPQVLPGGVLTWAPFIPMGGVWTQTVEVEMGWGYSGTLTNLVHVTTLQGASGSYTTTSQAVAQVLPPETLGQGECLSRTVDYGLKVCNTSCMTEPLSVAFALYPNNPLTYTNPITGGFHAYGDYRGLRIDGVDCSSPTCAHSVTAQFWYPGGEASQYKLYYWDTEVEQWKLVNQITGQNLGASEYDEYFLTTFGCDTLPTLYDLTSVEGVLFAWGYPEPGNPEGLIYLPVVNKAAQ